MAIYNDFERLHFYRVLADIIQSSELEVAISDIYIRITLLLLNLNAATHDVLFALVR
jgi:hypothetical protein